MKHTAQWSAPVGDSASTAFIKQHKQIRVITNDGDNSDYIDFILPHKNYGDIFGLGKDFQVALDKHLAILKSNGIELNWPSVGLEHGNELDLWNMMKDNIKYSNVLHKVIIKSQNYVSFGYYQHRMRIHLVNMDNVDKQWHNNLLRELQQHHGHMLHELESIVIHKRCAIPIELKLNEADINKLKTLAYRLGKDSFMYDLFVRESDNITENVFSDEKTHKSGTKPIDIDIQIEKQLTNLDNQIAHINSEYMKRQHQQYNKHSFTLDIDKYNQTFNVAIAKNDISLLKHINDVLKCHKIFVDQVEDEVNKIKQKINDVKETKICENHCDINDVPKEKTEIMLIRIDTLINGIDNIITSCKIDDNTELISAHLSCVNHDETIYDNDNDKNKDNDMLHLIDIFTGIIEFNVSNNRGLVVDTTINIGEFVNNVDINCIDSKCNINTYKKTLVSFEDIQNAFQLFEIEIKYLLFDDMG